MHGAWNHVRPNRIACRRSGSESCVIDRRPCSLWRDARGRRRGIHRTHSPTRAEQHTHSAPKPTPTPTFAALDYNCDSILPPATLAVFKSKSSRRIHAAVRLSAAHAEHRIATWSPSTTYGGILCQWAYPDASNSVDYAFSPITETRRPHSRPRSPGPDTWASERPRDAVREHRHHRLPRRIPVHRWILVSGVSDSVMQLIVDNVFVDPS